MKYGELKEIAYKENFQLSDDVITDLLNTFHEDADSGILMFMEEFRLMYERILSYDASTSTRLSLHTISQIYLRYNNIPSDMRAFLYVKNSNYYRSIDAFAECARYVNHVLDINNAPDKYVLEALANMMGIIVDKSMKYDVMPYVERFGSYTQAGKLSSSSLVNLYTGLIEVYINLEMADIYEQIRPLQKAIRLKTSTDTERMSLDLRILAGDLLLLKRNVTAGHIEMFRNIVRAAEYDSDLMDTSAGCLIKVINILYDYLPDDEIIDSILKLIDVTESNSDRLQMYEYLDETLHIDKKEYVKVYNAYHRELKEYRKIHETYARQEFHNEITFYKKNSEYKEYATKDGMTGLLNRHAYEEAIDELRNGRIKSNLVIMMCDLNGLKTTNDTFGHKAGDELLITAANTIKNTLHSLGDVFRIGGDEFVAIIYTESPDVLVRTIKNTLGLYKLPNGCPATTAIGYAQLSEAPGKSLDTLIKLADERMYTDKKRYH